MQFKKLFDASDPQKSKLPPRWEAKKLSLLQRMCILRCLRPAKITLAVQVSRPSRACLCSHQPCVHSSCCAQFQTHIRESAAFADTGRGLSLSWSAAA